MLKDYHIEICKRALGDTFSSSALDVIVAANLGQDHIRYQFRHPHFHFDSNAFDAGFAYVEKQHQIVLNTLKSGKKLKPAWEAFGRLTHTVQDFYAHSNYVQLWADVHTNGDVPHPSEVGALDSDILQDPALHSGNIYFWDWLAFVPGCYSLALRLTPKDSHTHMNLDHPDRGPFFPYAIEAAVKCTVFEFEKIANKLDVTKLARFTNH